MPLDDLVSVIETLQQRIATHRQSLQQNEIRTRTALIDPLLTALGWDVSDPALVTPEYSVDGGWADYALRGPGNQPAAIVEAKRLGTLVENHLSQMVNYCIQEGIAYSGVTDGSHWQVYRTFEQVPLAEKRVLDVNIGNTPAYECALKLLLLWRPNLSSGKAIPAEEPVLGNGIDNPPPPQDSANWVSLPECNPPGGGPPPLAIRFSDDTERPIKQWFETLTYTADWLYARGQLDVSHLPVENSVGHRYVVSTEPAHPDGTAFKKSTLVQGAPYWVNIGVTAKVIRDYTRRLLNHCGIDPATVQLQMSQ